MGYGTQTFSLGPVWTHLDRIIFVFSAEMAPGLSGTGGGTDWLDPASSAGFPCFHTSCSKAVSEVGSDLGFVVE